MLKFPLKSRTFYTFKFDTELQTSATSTATGTTTKTLHQTTDFQKSVMIVLSTALLWHYCIKKKKKKKHMLVCQAISQPPIIDAGRPLINAF